MKQILYILLVSLLWGNPCCGFMLLGKGYKEVSDGGTIISYENYSSTHNDSSGLGSLTINTPTSTSSGDLLIASIFDSRNEATTSPTGWTSIVNSNVGNCWLGVFYREADGTESSSYTFTSDNTSTARQSTGVIQRFSKTSGSWDATVYNTAGASGSSSLTSGAVTTTDNSMLFATWGTRYQVSESTAPSDMTNIYKYESDRAAVFNYYESYTTGSSSVTKSITYSGSTDSNCVSIVIKAN